LSLYFNLAIPSNTIIRDDFGWYFKFELIFDVALYVVFCLGLAGSFNGEFSCPSPEIFSRGILISSCLLPRFDWIFSWLSLYYSLCCSEHQHFIIGLSFSPRPNPYGIDVELGL